METAVFLQFQKRHLLAGNGFAFSISVVLYLHDIYIFHVLPHINCKSVGNTADVLVNLIVFISFFVFICDILVTILLLCLRCLWKTGAGREHRTHVKLSG